MRDTPIPRWQLVFLCLPWMACSVIGGLFGGLLVGLRIGYEDFVNAWEEACR